MQEWPQKQSPRAIQNGQAEGLIFCLFFFCCILLFPPISYPAEITIAWSPATDAKVAGYRVYYRPPGEDGKFKADTGKETQITLKNLREGASYSFYVATYDSAGQESMYSQKTTITNLKDKNTHFFPIFPPRAPSPPAQEKSLPATPPECEFALSPASQFFGSSGGAGAVEVSTRLNCSWTAVANAPWVTITSNSIWTGTGVVYYLVKANPSASPREGTLTVAGRTIQLNQMGSARYSLKINQSGTGTGTVASAPAGTDFEAGTVVTLRAAPSADSTFAGWSGRCSGTKPTCKVTMNSNTSVNVAFKLKTFIISANAEANGSISPSGRVVVNHGGSQKFDIRPNKGYKIGGIKVDGVSVGNPGNLLFGNVMRSHRIEAIFSPIDRMGKR
jgi:hypothetical protein